MKIKIDTLRNLIAQYDEGKITESSVIVEVYGSVVEHILRTVQNNEEFVFFSGKSNSDHVVTKKVNVEIEYNPFSTTIRKLKK